MNSPQKFLSIAILFLALITVDLVAQPGPSNILKKILVEADSNRSPIIVTGGLIQPNSFIYQVYQANDYRLLWSQNSSSQLVNKVRLSFEDGLNPDDYHFQSLLRLHSKTRDEYESAIYDILLTDAFSRYATHLLYGREDPCILYPEKWEPDGTKVDMVNLLNEIQRTNSAEDAILSLEPKWDQYQKLKERLRYFRGIENEDWPVIQDGHVITVGKSDMRIPALRTRLTLLGQETRVKDSNDTLYDSLLYLAVKGFQERNGLAASGIVETQTIKALNFPVDYYIKKIEINLERCRWLPQSFGDRYIVVNIPAFSAEVWENDTLVLSMKAIVGRSDRTTPVFSSRMSYFICNPTWTVPPTILEEDVLPAVKRNRNYLGKNHLRVFDRTGIEIPPDSLPWSRYSISNFPYILRQDPGAFNSLGLIKFEFPNHFSVFLHDTNNRTLFRQPYRALSSGCIRLEKPFDLADYLLKNSKGASEKFREILASGTTGTMPFSPPMAIHVIYMTAFVDSKGQLNLRNDIYEWDMPLSDRLYANQ